jgi:hypothetical protein
MTPGTPTPDAPPPNLDALIVKNGAPTPPVQQPYLELQTDLPPSKPEVQPAAKPSPLTVEGNHTFPRQAFTVGCIVGLLTVGWWGFRSLAPAMIGRIPAVNDVAPGCFFLIFAAPVASIVFGAWFGGVGLVLQAIYLSIKNARDPDVQKMLRNLEETEEDDPEDEMSSESGAYHPWTDPGIKPEEDDV